MEKVRIEDSENSLLIIIGNSLPNSSSLDPILGTIYYYSSIFSGCGLKEVYIGRNLKPKWSEVESGCFIKAPFQGFGISKVVIGPYVTSIEMRCKPDWPDRYYTEQAFDDCEELTEVIFQSSLIKEIPEEAFSGCSNLQKIKLPNSVQRIEDWAFEECNSLSTIDLGESLEYIGYGSFSGCDQLSTINIHSSNPPSCESGFSSQSYINTIVNVPPGSLSLYQNTAPWNNFWNLKEDNHLSAGIDNASTTFNAEELTRYTINGQKISAPSKGLNIIRYNDGSVKKVVVQ